MIEKDKECQCEECQSACIKKPGWFKPGEVEKVAKYLDVSLEKLFKTKLMVDWWEDYPKNTFVLSPAIIGGWAGHEFSANPRGTCVFFKKGKCEIHAVKPFECRKAFHEETSENFHQQAAKSWENDKDQKQIKELLVREPKVQEYDFCSALFW